MFEIHHRNTALFFDSNKMHKGCIDVLNLGCRSSEGLYNLQLHYTRIILLSKEVIEKDCLVMDITTQIIQKIIRLLRG